MAGPAEAEPSPEAIFRELRRIAPDIAFSVYWVDNEAIVLTQEELQQRVREGNREYYVEASALTVMDGQVYEGKAVLTGFIYKLGELDPDLGGWLPYLLWDATLNLSNKFKSEVPQVEAAVRYLNGARRYGR
jgi:hypothetical protein